MIQREKTMKRIARLLSALLVAGLAVASPAIGADETLVTGAGTGIFPGHPALYGISLNGMELGLGVIIVGDGTASGDLQALLPGTTLLGQPQTIAVEGRVATGSLNIDGSATVAGVSRVDLGNGTPALLDVPFSAVVTTQGTQLTLGVTALPAAGLTEGVIEIGP